MKGFLIAIKFLLESIVNFLRAQFVTFDQPDLPASDASDSKGNKPTSASEPINSLRSRDDAITQLISRRYRVGHMIVIWEARLDESGYPKLYKIPSGDGGGKFEISGINSKYHFEALERIRKANPEERRKLCAEYIDDYVRKHTGIHWGFDLCPGTELAVLDCAFNRGPGAAARIAQTALKSMKFPVSVDGVWGPQTRSMLREADQRRFPVIEEIRRARETYERRNRDESSKFWKGLVNRWNKVTEEAMTWNWNKAHNPSSLDGIALDSNATNPIPEWFQIAKREIGTKEIKGSRHNPKILEYWEDSELFFKDDETPWCAGFVGAMLKRAGIDGTASGMARSYERWGNQISKPTLGAVVVFYRGSRSSGSGHVGFYAGHDENGNIMVLGGNQSDAVNIKPFPCTRLIGYFWPKQAPFPSINADPLLTSNGEVSTNEA